MSIVTLPCNFSQYRAVSFDIWRVYSDRIFLANLSAKWNGYAPVTEAGQDVCKHCHARYGNKRVVRGETMVWQWHELVHEDGIFNGIKPYTEEVPFGVWAEWNLQNAGGA
ncbi:hypothetical protein SAMN04488498_12933 [Mesorhizobium albiziae]|uniref:Uncharacterized protein n=1 Tax=Neomesorhizobium albiziae TaxID=335020 RepID=A0A1I4ER77_9HYPH|nr:hypothetical protein [Mesorhizobium albiziae]GLS30793.1 hypothetical protein GCM10007937_25010 [Mesorhizobium albiziae]SFL07809.1 hypothetical protein SAMN04488498_12933 [Mesorhizobium albiziae]